MACIITSLKCHSTCHLVSRKSVSRTGQQRLRDINTDISPKSHSWKNFHFRSVWIQSPLAFPACFFAKQRWKWTELEKEKFPSKARAAALVRRDLCSGTWVSRARKPLREGCCGHDCCIGKSKTFSVDLLQGIGEELYKAPSRVSGP